MQVCSRISAGCSSRRARNTTRRTAHVRARYSRSYGLPMLRKRNHRMADNSAPGRMLTAGLSRAGFLRLAARMTAGLGAALLADKLAGAQTRDEGTAMQTRPIPSTGEMLPVVGCGTWRTFDVGAGSRGTRAARRGAPRAVRGRRLGDRHLADVWRGRGRGRRPAGGRGHARKAFIATKVWTSGRDSGIAQMTRSLRCSRPTTST